MAASQIWVIKIGTSVITGDGDVGLSNDTLRSIADQVGQLCAQGQRVLLVSSGAVGLGMERAGTAKRPEALDQLQALAALGQSELVARWQKEFERHSLHAALVLLTRLEMEDRQRYLNVRNTLSKLHQMQAIPIINENDSVSTEELQFGDNDTLASHVADLVGADRLVILTDRDGFYRGGDPARNADATLITQAAVSDPTLDAEAQPSAGLQGRGGMRSKLSAARAAALAGCSTWIVNGRTANALLRLQDGEQIGTWLECDQKPSSARQRWLAGRSDINGTLHLDSGAVNALAKTGASLLPVGIVCAEGSFRKGDLVRCLSPEGKECAVGLTNYSAQTVEKIAGQRSAAIAQLLQGPFAEEVIHRDNMYVMTEQD